MRLCTLVCIISETNIHFPLCLVEKDTFAMSWYTLCHTAARPPRRSASKLMIASPTRAPTRLDVIFKSSTKIQTTQKKPVFSSPPSLYCISSYRPAAPFSNSSNLCAEECIIRHRMHVPKVSSRRTMDEKFWSPHPSLDQVIQELLRGYPAFFNKQLQSLRIPLK